MQFTIAVSFLVALAAVNAYEYTPEVAKFDIDAVAPDPEQLKSLVGCFLETTTCSPIGAEFKRDIGDAVHTACANCTPEQKVILRKFLNGLKDKLPEERKAFYNKYDPEGKYASPLAAAIA